MHDGAGMVLRLKTITPKYTPSLTDMRSKVIDQYYAEKARSTLERDMKQAVDLARNNGLNTVLEKYPEARKVSPISPFSPRDRETVLNLQQQNLPIKAMISLKKVGQFAEQMVDSTGYLVYFADQSERNSELYQAEYSKIEQKLYEEQKTIIEQGFVASLQRHAKIEGADLYHSFIPE